MPTTREYLTSTKEKYYPDNRVEWVKDAIESLGIARNTVYNVSGRIWPTDKKKIPEPENVDDRDIISPADFLNSIDTVGKVLTYLNDTVRDGYIEDDKLRRKFNITSPKWLEMSKLPVFEDRKFTYTDSKTNKKTTAWSSVKGVKEAEKSISMARYET